MPRERSPSPSWSSWAGWSAQRLQALPTVLTQENSMNELDETLGRLHHDIRGAPGRCTTPGGS
ncbi:hypothetical protein [Amycolatopsis acidiphila]|uniref:hypothetical protein n=1 Tax=Amycolatopsis acidiphila TaxID=715473 RepID=UPI001E2A5602|nr:hypothetical protein [Amycolatopsis acidiphila]